MHKDIFINHCKLKVVAHYEKGVFVHFKDEHLSQDVRLSPCLPSPSIPEAPLTEHCESISCKPKSILLVFLTKLLNYWKQYCIQLNSA